MRSRESLWNAWHSVFENAIHSESPDTRAKALEYSKSRRVHLDRIGRKLKDGQFVFKPQTGVLLKKKNKSSKRPIVIAPIDSRIVQRAILNVLQAIPAIRDSLTAGFNFGGVPGDKWGVPGAVLKVLENIQTKPYYIRTDIKSFFMNVPRREATERLLRYVSDSKLSALVKSAVTTEIEDAQSYGEDIRLFPLADKGVAQGSCLSPLVCNNLLADFDRIMNDRGIVMVRYIDDFLLLAKDRKSAFAAFSSAQRLLAELGLDAYDPRVSAEADKAEHGSVKDGMLFLGCEILPHRLRPSAENWKGLLVSLRKIFDSSLNAIKSPDTVLVKHSSYAETVVRASKTVQGWANTFSFCTDDQLMKNIDIELTKVFDAYNASVKRAVASLSPLERRKTLGIFSIDDRIASDESERARQIIARAMEREKLS